MKRQINLLWTVVLTVIVLMAALSSCGTVKSGCPSNVSHWERTHRFNK